jgi:hypothetical protein
VISVKLNVSCEDGFDDLGAADSAIVTLSDQFIHFSRDFLVNSHSKLLFRNNYDKLRTARIKCTALSIRQGLFRNHVNPSMTPSSYSVSCAGFCTCTYDSVSPPGCTAKDRL